MTLEKIKNSINTLSNTIEDFKTLVEFKGQKQRVNIKQLIETLIKPYKNMSEFSINIDDNINVEIYENRVINIFNNIIQNSIEAMNKNSIENRIINILIKNDYNILNIEISDNAGGIDKSIIHRVFEPYFSTKEQQHGVGLGLYICKNILELHLNGSIKLENKNNGVVVSIKLPVNEGK